LPTPRLTRPNPLKQAHKVSEFECGEPALDVWLQKHAFAAVQARTANTFVVCRGRRVVGYYSLATAAVPHESTSAKVRRNTPNPIPAMLLARLARDVSEIGNGLGEDLLADASRRVLAAARHTAARMLIVHPISDRAVEFYARYGFLPLRGETAAMYKPVAELVSEI
jgi:predicted N-acetyltransferase YhbS